MYLIASVIIISLVAALLTVSNYSKKINPIEIYKLGEELEIESASLLEYGTAQNFDNTEMHDLMSLFIEEYIDYSDIERLYFIFGNETDITFGGYHEFIEEEVSLKIGDAAPVTIDIPQDDYIEADFPGLSANQKVKINTSDLNYEFELREGENFYFVLSQEVDQEHYVVSGGNKD